MMALVLFLMVLQCVPASAGSLSAQLNDSSHMELLRDIYGKERKFRVDWRCDRMSKDLKKWQLLNDLCSQGTGDGVARIQKSKMWMGFYADLLMQQEPNIQVSFKYPIPKAFSRLEGRSEVWIHLTPDDMFSERLNFSLEPSTIRLWMDKKFVLTLTITDECDWSDEVIALLLFVGVPILAGLSLGNRYDPLPKPLVRSQ